MFTVETFEYELAEDLRVDTSVFKFVRYMYILITMLVEDEATVVAS